MAKFDWLKHAFAVEKNASVTPSDRQRELVDSFCAAVVRRKMRTPVFLALETVQPLNYVGSQMIHVLAPFAGLFVDANSLTELASFLEQRGAIDYIIQRLEELDGASPDGTHTSAGSDADKDQR